MIPVGLLPPYRAGVAADLAWMTRFARTAEDLGFESLYLAEHVVVPAGYLTRYPYAPTGRMPLPDDCPLPDPIDLAAFLLARTERLVLATGVVVAPHHHPLVLAKRASTLAALSGGRFRLGVGVGWMREELAATGVEWSTRGERLDECLAAMDAVWSGQPASFSGRHFSFSDVHTAPGDRVPVHIGGHSAAAARRAGRYGDGYQPLGLDGDGLAARWALVRETASACGRDAGRIELTLGAQLASLDLDKIAELEARGATRVLASTAGGDPAEVESALEHAANRLGIA